MKKRLLVLVLTLCIASTNTIGVLAASVEEAPSQETVEIDLTEESGNEDEGDENDDHQKIDNPKGDVGDNSQEGMDLNDVGDQTQVSEKDENTDQEESDTSSIEKVEEEITDDIPEDTEVNVEKNIDDENSVENEEVAVFEPEDILESAKSAERKMGASIADDKVQNSKAGLEFSAEENMDSLIEYIMRYGTKVDVGWKISSTDTSGTATYTGSILVNANKGFVAFQLQVKDTSSELSTCILEMDYYIDRKEFDGIAGIFTFKSAGYYIVEAEIDPPTYFAGQELEFKCTGHGAIDNVIDELCNLYKDIAFAFWETMLEKKASTYFAWIGFPNLCYAHKWNGYFTVDKEATCTEEGSKSIHCYICGKTDESSVQVIPKKEHSYGDWSIINGATCTEAGNREKSCTECGDKVNETIPPKGHQWETEYTIDQEPTRTEEGRKSIHCAICDEINESTVQVIPVLSGTWIKNSNGWWYSWNDGTYPKNQFETIGGTDYYFNASGYMVTGWQKINGSWYYFSGNGAKQTGWQSIGGKWYYFDENGVMEANEWVGNYYLGAGGAMVTGWQKIGGVWYYFSGSGAKQTGWQKISNTWYYFDESGVMQTGRTDVRGKVYYFSAGGAMQTGWQKIDNKWYYFEGNGAMAVSKWAGNYYLTESGEMAVNQWIGKYYVGADGKWIPGYAAN